MDTQQLWTDLCGQRHVPAWQEVLAPPWKVLNVQWPARDEWCPFDGFWFPWGHLNQCLNASELEPASQRPCPYAMPRGAGGQGSPNLFLTLECRRLETVFV